jgi:TetR/AcrR family transcriptional regulator, regulator of cefoperazone and chloramphenicol sensitivity
MICYSPLEKTCEIKTRVLNCCFMAKAAPVPSDPTREKLLEAAGQVFAENGFHAATVREICSRAGANVAAVNYYFGDKSELYEEVLRRALFTVHDAQMREALATVHPEEALRRSIRYMLGKMCDARRPNWAMRLVTHEMAQPTPALDRVIDEIIGPNYAMLRGIIGRMLNLPPDHEKTRLCAHSVIGQILHYKQAQAAISRLWPDLQMTEPRIDRIAQHIADFSLAYLKENANLKPRRKTS